MRKVLVRDDLGLGVRVVARQHHLVRGGWG